MLGEHERCFARHQAITDEGHRKAAAAMRQAYQGRTAAARVPAADDVQQRDLADYDEIFGLDDGREVA